ncbi:uncharacterized protein MONOS_4582 [Monocercomonoides exilis]|uniref:uncharacterized protein n=1 Tax=Monocercomonoides exilis TaxID=2049356 RepID=UPI003559D3E0|nr:hypothetical protein MONOS_4582 [Monocercomonoides exilis]|eukprot:MONOS_4582.1-p1 / transcript=MONOS_4582.1 / gene=MONOS_4582 / organism=Monocercomonoides_exilis_PA203 / gene_product=unspecified product / transcript_product=unspecified product / location=Mono_scaffold00123:51051-59852(-) / protein_length=2914 / sequence_SO=supercontig / SO=protein_coding / is_pseudo=false
MNEYMQMKNACSFGNEELLKNKENNENLDNVKDFKQIKHRNTESLLSFRDYGRISEQSQIIGNMRLINSSVELKGIELIGDEIGRIVCGMRGSVVVVRGCGVEMGKGKEAGVFELGGCRGMFWNITLRGIGRGGNVCGRLFGGGGRMEQTKSEREGGGIGRAGLGRGSGRGEGGERGEQGGSGGGREKESEGGGSVLVSESHFSSFCVSSAPFLAPPLTRLVSLTQLTFFNISTNPSKTTYLGEGLGQRVFLMSGCSFSSVWDVYDGGIVPSLNSPSSSLTASNSSFVRCYRSGNIAISGSEGNPSKPARQQIADNGANSFTWCVWNGTKTTGSGTSYSDGTSNGGAIYMYSKTSGTLSVKFCSFNDCTAYSQGGGVMCANIKSVEIENNSFSACSSETRIGGGLCVFSISACVRISGCEFQKCSAKNNGGGLFLQSFDVSGSGCIGTESGKGESACVFECFFTLCTLSITGGGGMYCQSVPAAFKMRSIQFISCSATAYGGGMRLYPYRQTTPDDGIYCYFLFFHECKCSAATPYGRDVMYYDNYNLYLSSNNPFYECYTTNTDEQRVCYGYNYSNAGAWTFQHTEKKEWLKDKTIYVSVSGNDTSFLCGANETFPCLTVKKAFEMCEIQISLTITLMEGNHTSEATTIEIGEKKISVIGTGKDKSSIGTGTLSSVGTLFSVTTGHLGMSHMKVDCNSNSSPSPSVVVVSDGSGSLSLEDVVITTSKTGDYVISSSVFVVQLSQLLITDVEIINMNVSKPLFSEPDQSSPSSSSLSSSSSSALYLTATASGDSVLANMKVTNVKLTSGDGVVVAKSVKAGETFVVKNVTIEDCECKAGSGGGIKVDLLSPSSKLRVGTSSAPGSETTKFNRCKCSGYGGGIMLHLADDSHDFSIVFVDFSGCTASLSGNYVFVNGSDSARWAIATEKLNIQHDSSKYNELVGYDRSNTSMGLLPLNVFLDTISGAAHVGKGKDGLGGYDSWFCGLDYYPCATITHTARARFSGGNKNIELDPEFVLAEKVAMDDAYVWDISCATKGTAIEVKVPTTFESENFLIDVQSRCSIKKIKFIIPSALSSASAMISAHSPSFNITDCSVVSSPDSVVGQSIGYSFVNAFAGKLRMEQFEIREGLTFDGHSLVEFVAGVSVVYFKGCNIANVRKINGDGGLIKGAVGTQFGEGEGKVGIVVIETCTVINCNCQGKSEEIGKGGGICVSLDGEGSVVVNGTSTIDSCEAKNNGGGTKGRGGGMMLTMESPNCKMEIAENVKFSSTSSSLNDAQYGKDVFVCCDSTILLGTKVNANSFKFFDNSAIPSDELKFCGSEDGKDEKVIPLFVYLFSIGSKLTVDGKGEVALDHSSCGFEKFGCLTIDYCVTNRINYGLQKVEVSSESSIKSEMKVLSFDVSLTGKAVTAGKKMKVEVKDGGEISQNGLIECTKSFEMTNLAFVMNKVINGRRSAFVHSSSSTITITSCSVSFASNALTSEKIGYSIIDMTGGELIVDGLMMEIATTLTTNGKSPITMTNGEKLNIKNSRVSGVTVEGGSGGGGCIGAAIKEEGSAVVDNCSISTTCTGGGGMKGGGMMISAENGGSLEIKSVTFTGCQVPAEDNLQKGRGIGGGMFVSLADTMGSFVMEGMKFEGCSAWKGKRVFISGNELDDVISNEKLKEELSSSDEKSLDELCGWERKTTGKGYVIPLVVYLWTNWSGNGFVSKDNGGDFSGCGFSEAPCSSIDHLISLRYEPLGKGETHINIVGSGLLSHSISFSSSLPPASQDSDSPKVVIEGTKKGTSVTITDEDENDLDDGSMISSNVSLSFFNLSFTKPSITTNHAVFIESSGTNAFLTVTDCSFGSLTGLIETAGYCVMKVNGGSATIQSCTLNKINGLKGFISFSPIATEVTVQNVNISFAGVTERSLISMMEEESQMNEKENTHSNANGNRPVLRVVGCSFSNITKEGIGASVIEVGSFENGVECTIEECAMKSCKSALSDEGGGMKVELKNEESVLKVNGSTFSMCRCSTESGRGGGLFINGADPNVNYADETQIPCLRIFIVNIMFYMNEAFVGNDIFIKCYSIIRQINETMFALNFNQESLNSDNSICGSDIEGNTDMDLIPRITFFKGLQVFLNWSGADGRRCGAQANPCSSINCGVDHIQEGVMNAILIDGEGVVSGECVIGDLVVNSFKKKQAIVKLKSKIEKSAEKDCIMEFVNECSVERCSFQFEDGFESTHNYLMKVKNGITKIQECEFFSSSTTTVEFMKLNSSVVSVESGELKISETTFRDIHSKLSVISFCEESDVTIDETRMSNINCEGNVVSVGGKAKVEMKEMKVENVTMMSKGCVIGMEDAEQEVSVLNSSFGRCANSVDKGRMMQVRNSKNVRIVNCVFDGEKEIEFINEENNRKEGLCKWNGSLVDVEKSNVEMRETTVMKNKGGGLWVSGGSMKIEKGEFENNNPSIEGYPSARRNVICEGNGELNVVSVKGGDGWERNTSLWILDEGCEMGGITSERESSYFIPVLEEVKNTTQPSGGMDLSIHGKLLLPCNLSVKISMKDGEVEHIQTQKIEDGCVSENEVHSDISSELVETMENKSEISVCILFGKAESPSSTHSLIMKNKSEIDAKVDERMSEGEDKIEWSFVAFIGCIVVIVILLFVIVVVIVLQRRKENRGGRRVEDGDIEITKNVGKGEWRKEDIAERVEEEEEEEGEMRTLLAGEMRNEMRVLTEKGEELNVCENKGMVESGFDREEIIAVAPVNYIEMQTVASLLSREKDGNMEIGSFAGGKEDESISKGDRKVKRGKRKKGKKRKHVEEDDEIGDEKEVSEAGLEELGGVTSEDGRNGMPTEYYIGICSAQNSNFSMIGEDSEEKVVNKVLDKAKEVVKEDKEEEREEEKPKKRKKKKKRNQKREEKSEIVRDITEMGLLDAG